MLKNQPNPNLDIEALIFFFIRDNLKNILQIKLDEIEHDALKYAISIGLRKTQKIVERIVFSLDQQFNLYNSQQNAILLYHVGRALFLQTQQHQCLIDGIFYLNKIINCVDIYPKTYLPGAFFLSHGVSCVLGDAEYGNNLVFFQNVTIGRVGQKRPQLGNNIILYPGATISGSSIINDNTVVGAGCVIHDTEVSPNSVVINTPRGMRISANTSNRIGEFFSFD